MANRRRGPQFRKPPRRISRRQNTSNRNNSVISQYTNPQPFESNKGPIIKGRDNERLLTDAQIDAWCPNIDCKGQYIVNCPGDNKACCCTDYDLGNPSPMADLCSNQEQLWNNPKCAHLRPIQGRNRTTSGTGTGGGERQPCPTGYIHCGPDWFENPSNPLQGRNWNASDTHVCCPEYDYQCRASHGCMPGSGLGRDR
tara:strand:- start:7 stop:600 length:594 start_codon:yes stop_codon:yes gene_type:complete